MSVIDLLLKINSQLRLEIQELAAHLYDADVLDKIKLFASHYKMSEAIEDNLLFPRLNISSENKEDIRAIASYRTIRKGAWPLIEELQFTFKTGSSLSILRAFQNFYVLANSHIDYEEQWIFPTLRRLLPQETLIEIGIEARKQFSQFNPPEDDTRSDYEAIPFTSKTLNLSHTY